MKRAAALAALCFTFCACTEGPLDPALQMDRSAPPGCGRDGCDTVPPPPPPPLLVDTLALWPPGFQLDTGQQLQVWVAFRYTDGSSSCEAPPAAPGALYESGTFTAGCDSALALLAPPPPPCPRCPPGELADD